MDLTLLALSPARAARLTGLTARQLEYWHRTGLVVPGIDTRLSPRRPVRLYEYPQLVALLVIAELRRRGVTLQHVRRIVAHLQQLGLADPFRLRYATSGSGVYFLREDDTWESDTLPGQGVLTEVLDLAPLVTRLRAAAARDPATHGRTERRRGTLGHVPLLAGTRLPVAAARAAPSAYPLLTPQDVVAARREAA